MAHYFHVKDYVIQGRTMYDSILSIRLLIGSFEFFSETNVNIRMSSPQYEPTIYITVSVYFVVLYSANHRAHKRSRCVLVPTFFSREPSFLLYEIVLR